MAIKKNSQHDERRRHSRADREISIRHRLVNENSKIANTAWNLSNTRNMSIGGLLFFGEVPYKVGDLIEFHVVMSGAIDVVKGVAQVIRVIQKRNKYYDVAVKYIQNKPKKRSAKKHI